MLVHGILHAVGLDHERSAAQACAMETLETQILSSLGIATPY
jgi:ssRNA-specific RNase YbeY (16S rRNA maturation enzyme)